MSKRNFIAKVMWQNPLFKSQVIKNKKKEQEKKLTRRSKTRKIKEQYD